MKTVFVIALAGSLVLNGYAGPVTQTFDAGPQDWKWSHFANAAGGMSNGTASVAFRSTGLPVPAHSTLYTLGGPFIGDYDASDIQLIGFRFMAASMPENETPLTVDLLLEGDGILFSKSFTPVSTSVWHTFSADVTSAEKGGWVNVTGEMEDFQVLRRNVRSVKIRMLGSSPLQENRYFIDDVYLDYLPSIAVRGDEGGMIMEISEARESQRYRLQVSQNLMTPDGGWMNAPDTLSATGRVIHLNLPAPIFDDDQSMKYYRIVLE